MDQTQSSGFTAWLQEPLNPGMSGGGVFLLIFLVMASVIISQRILALFFKE